MRSGIVLSVVSCLVFCASAVAQRGELKVGDPAPGLDIAQWVKGEETSIQPGTVYVVEFWATWCVPCRKSIPHLTELQKQHADSGLRIIGISYEEPDVVEPFVSRQGDKMGYTVAVDRRSSTKRAFMDAAGLNGIPAAFIVDRKGIVAFIGNPLQDDFDEILGKVVANRYNPKLEKEAEPVLAAARAARKVRNWRMAEKHYDQVIELDSRVFANVAIAKFDMFLLDMKDRQRAYEYVRTDLIGSTFADDGEALRMLAVKLSTDPSIPGEQRDLDAALDAAQKARELSGNADPRTLSTLALVHYHRGELEEAVELQKRAYFMAKPEYKPEYRRVLTSYQEAAGRRASR